MAVEAFEDRISLEIEVLESVPLAPSDDETRDSASPFPRLQITGRTETIDLHQVVLENEWLRVAIWPDLGGRIGSIYDKRTGTEILDRPPMAAVDGGRGVRWDAGIQWTLDGSERLNALGPVDYQIIEADGPDDDAAVLLGELSSGTPYSWHVHIALKADRAALEIGAKMTNRSRTRARYAGGLLIGALNPNGSVHIESDPGTFEIPYLRHAAPQPMGPRQVDNWTCTVSPWSLPDATHLGEHAAVALHTPLEIQVDAPYPQSRIQIRTVAGTTHEAKVDLSPDSVSSFDLTALGTVDAVAIQSSDQRLLFSTLDSEVDTEAVGLRRALLHGDERGAACVGLALLASRRGDYAEAIRLIDDAFLYNGEDHLAWWLKAVLTRVSNAEAQDGAPSPLLNAHFLAPFEPALRAESFLAQPEKALAASPLVAPMANNPDAMVEVACLLHEAGLQGQLTQWVEECLRHREVAMLHFLLADAMLDSPSTAVDAAQHVQAGVALPAASPAPWRPLELAVLARLRAKFPAAGW